MIINKNQLAKNFNKAAHTYDKYSTVQQKMAYHLLEKVTKTFPNAKRILEIGCGTGYLTQLLTAAYPNTSITAIDLAENMIKVAQEQVDDDHVTFLQADAEDMSSLGKETYDLVISNATIHWFQNPKNMLQEVMKLLKPGGLFFSSALGTDTLQELRMCFRRVEEDLGVEPVEHLIPLSSIESWIKQLGKAGFESSQAEGRWLRQIYKDCRELLISMKATGDSYRANRQSLFEARKVLIRVMHRYNLAYRSKNGVYATYQWIQMMGRKPMSDLATTM